MRLSLAEERNLCELWARRAALTREEWAQLYSLVAKELHTTHLSLAAWLPHESQDDLVNAFYLNKVHVTRKSGSRLDHAGALHDYFKKFLISMLRGAKARPLEYKEDGGAEDAEPAWSANPLCGETAAPGLLPIARGKVEAAAPQLIASLESDDLRYLIWQLCADRDPLNKFAKHHRIANYHAKALRLGITRKKGEFHHGYAEQTVLGRWLHGLGIAPEPDNEDAVCEAFTILCQAIRVHLAGSHDPA